MTQVAILWHMHQPFYEDLVTHEHILPWVRLHALKDYWGMAALLREFPDVKVTFNLVPSLLVQLEDFSADRAHDRCLELSLKPAGDLTPVDVDFILANFFHAHRQYMIDAYPRYGELLARRGGPWAPGRPASERHRAALNFTVEDLRDLQVWHKLAWLDPSYFETDPRVRRLVEKGSHFDEDDKLQLRAIELELLNKVIPEYRALAARGQIELSTSPFYHPILPLLCDSDIYLRTHPDATKPRQRFMHPEDAAEQLERAAACHERLFGARPVGLWPSEGSVSDAMIPLVAAAGFRWMATDESILANSIGMGFSRDGNGQVDQPERLYTPYIVGAEGSAGVACAFRDHTLSDLIGFVYSGWSADRAADDFVGRLVEAGRRYSARTGGGEALIPVILDGENAWEHFPGGGRPFLRALYGRLASHPELRTVTMAEGCRSPRERIVSIFPGSWIDGNFYIWIGHQDDQRAWSQLGDARQALDQPGPGVDAAALAAAREEVLVAEGSDWYWWYGDDHSSDHDLEFDDLFRRHLRNVYRLLRKPVPDELFLSNISTTAIAPADTDPTGFLSPTLDGEETSYFEWLGAGALEIHETAGAMHQTDRRPPIATLVQFGFDLQRFYLRLDCGRPVEGLLNEGYLVTLTFLQPAASVTFSRRGHRLTPGAAAAVATVLEVAIPLSDLGATAGDTLSFVVAIADPTGTEVERHPAYQTVDVHVPDRLFESRNWSA